MGKDIHLIIQLRENNNWSDKIISDVPEILTYRNYTMFQFLEENFGKRGVPKELRNKKLNYVEKYEYYDFDTTPNSDLFGFSYVEYDELKELVENKNKFTISQEFLNVFFELGGKLPDGMTIDENNNGIYFEPLDEDEIQLLEYLNKSIVELQTIAKRNNVSTSDLRLLFAFDW